MLSANLPEMADLLSDLRLIKKLMPHLVIDTRSDITSHSIPVALLQSGHLAIDVAKYQYRYLAGELALNTIYSLLLTDVGRSICSFQR